MPWLVPLLRAIFTSPRVEFYAILFLSSIIKKAMNEEDAKTPATVEVVPTKAPLGLPFGSVRALLVLILTISFVVSYFFPDRVSLPPAIESMWILALGYYIGFRTDSSPSSEIKA